MTSKGAPSAFTHNLEKLVDECSKLESDFASLVDDAASLTPFAVSLRYDDEFWPTAEEAADAISKAEHIRDFAIQRAKN